MNKSLCFGEYIPQRRATIPSYYARVKVNLHNLSVDTLRQLAEETEKKIMAIDEDLANCCIAVNEETKNLEITSNHEIMRKKHLFPATAERLQKRQSQFWEIVEPIVDNIIKKYK